MGRAKFNRISRCHERGPCRRTKGCGVETLKAHALLRQAVNIGRLNIAAVITNIGPAEIIGEKDNDVRRRGVCVACFNQRGQISRLHRGEIKIRGRDFFEFHLGKDEPRN